MRTRLRRSALATAVAALTVLGATACVRTVEGEGAGPPAAAPFIAAMVVAMQGQDHGFALTLTSSSESPRITVRTRVQGDRGSGTFQVGTTTCELRAVDGRAYGKATAGFWTSYQVPVDVADSIDGVWVELTGSPLASATQYLLQDEVVAQVGQVDLVDPQPATGTTVRGTAAWRFSDSGDTMSVSIAASGPPLLLQIQDPRSTLDVTFPGDDLTVTAPDDPVPFPG